MHSQSTNRLFETYKATVKGFGGLGSLKRPVAIAGGPLHNNRMPLGV